MAEMYKGFNKDLKCRGFQCVDAIYMLKDWKDSNGARLELNYAKCKGKEILYED